MSELTHFTRLWNPIMEAMSKASLSGNQHRLCWAIWRLTYSWHRTEIEVSHQTLADETGINSKKIGAPLRALLAANIIIEVRQASFAGAGIYKFNKDIRTWAEDVLDLSLISDKTLEIVGQECDKNTAENSTITVSTSPQVGGSPQSGTSPQTRGEDSPQKGGEVPPHEARDDGIRGTPKERFKESSVLLFPPTPHKREQLEDVLASFTRYGLDAQALLRDYWELISQTRYAGNLPMSIVRREMQLWEQHPVDIVLAALDVHLRGHTGKREQYTRGIMRQMAVEAELERVAPAAEASPYVTSKRSSRRKRKSVSNVDYDDLDLYRLPGIEYSQAEEG